MTRTAITLVCVVAAYPLIYFVASQLVTLLSSAV